jgi:hypothetical protein
MDKKQGIADCGLRICLSDKIELSLNEEPSIGFRIAEIAFV